MSDYYPVYLDVVVIIEVQELLGELGPVVGDDRVGDPKAEDIVLEKAYHLFGADLGQGPSLDSLSELVDHKNKWVNPSRAFLKGPKRSRPNTAKGHMMGMVWSSWTCAWTCLTKYRHTL
jgi:hypothetical protein